MRTHVPDWLRTKFVGDFGFYLSDNRTDKELAVHAGCEGRVELVCETDTPEELKLALYNKNSGDALARAVFPLDTTWDDVKNWVLGVLALGGYL